MANTKTNANIKARNIALGMDVLKTPSIPAATSGTTITKYERTGVNRFRVAITVASHTKAIAGAALGFGTKIFDFPLGGIVLHSMSGNITLSAPTETAVMENAFGSVVASGAIGTFAGATATFFNLKETFNMNALAATATVNDIAWNGSGAIVDGSTSATDMYMNFCGTFTKTENITILASLEIEYSIL